MSVDRYCALDESSLRALLDGTVDLDERRLIRSAIRELRRREIEDMEAALASKRVRLARFKQQEDKENQHRSESSDTLDVLSQKLQSIRDIDELTKMLRAAGEFEERKMIRAAIRRIREDQQQGSVEGGKTSLRCLEPESATARSSAGALETEEENFSEREHTRAHVRELRNQQKGRDQQRPDSNAGMVLVLDSLMKDEVSAPPLIQSQREAVMTEADLSLSHLQMSDSTPSNLNVTSVLPGSILESGASEKGLGSTFRARVDSGASDKSESSSQCRRLDSETSEQSTKSQTSSRQRMGSDVSDSGAGPRPHSCSGTEDSAGMCSRKRTDSETSNKSLCMSSEERAPVEEVEVATSSSCYSTDSESENRSQDMLQAQCVQELCIEEADHEQPDGAVLTLRDPENNLLSSGTGDKCDFQIEKVTAIPDQPLLTHDKVNNAAPEKNGVMLEQFRYTKSVRDRMCMFTEPSQNQDVPALKKGSLTNGTTASTGDRANLAKPAELFAHTAASLSISGDNPARPRANSTSGGASQNQATLQPRGVANSTLPSSSLSQDSMGRSTHPAEKDTHVSSDSKEERTPGTAAGQQVTQGEADSDMKTFLTIEIKDGHTTSSSTSSPRGNMVPITTMTPHVGTNTQGQRAELTLGLRATPFKLSTSSISSGSLFKVEAEPVVASEPLFSVGPSVHVPCRISSIPNGSATQAKPQEPAGKLTAEQLAAIEDEELLDKMLDESKDFEERKMIRAAMRDLRKRKRDQREKEREVRLQELRQQRDDRMQKSRVGIGAGEVVMRKVEKSADGSTLSHVTKTNRFALSDDGIKSTRSTIVESSYVQKTDRGTVQSKSYSYTSSSTSSSSTTKKVGSVFDREDDMSSRSSNLAAMERRQAERRKELMRAQTLPKTSATQARKAMIEKLEKEGGGPGNQAVAKVNMVQRSTSFGVPNANSIKQMLLDWCRAKTRSYEHVDIQNFSSSWSNGMAFCALVHHFFPEAFDYDSLSPSNRRQNFEVAFNAAEKLVDCPQLLDVDDMVKLREPDWKCVYTYLQEFYRGLVTKGLVKTKNSS